MVCIYCGSSTNVTNSRHQRRSNNIWRRRSCDACKSLFTTIEQPELAGSLVVEGASGQLCPFLRDQLFVSVLESCKHRPSALQDATSLTQLIIDKLLHRQSQPGVIQRGTLVSTAHAVLKRFDHAAATFYQAYHPLTGKEHNKSSKD